ncbi:MAG TPA: DUF4388 domain-containing protein [Mycobacteriales bacterium]|nr:DUF4388 domain-containing protein [Mycobacteriales bacterium]
MKLEGTLDAFSLPDIFSLLSMTKKSGGLHLRRAGAHGAVWFHDGMITGGVSDMTRQLLARRIAGSNRISDEALTAAITQVRLDGELGVARVLRDADAIDEGDLHSLVNEQIVDAVFDLMRWQDGSFAFVIDEANRDGVGVSCRVEDVVLEARHRLDIWASVDPAVANPAAILTMNLDPGVEPQLTADEWSLVALVDGHRSVGDIVELCGRGEYAVVMTLADLVARGLLQVGDGSMAALERRQEQLTALENLTAGVRELRPVDPPVTEPAALAGVAEPEAPVAAPAPPPPPAAPGPVAADPPAASLPAFMEDRQPVRPRYEERPSPPMASVSRLRPEPAPSPFTSGREALVPEQDRPSDTAITAASPAAAVIARDPNVNKSLLLRLIAGVRGL